MKKLFFIAFCFLFSVVLYSQETVSPSDLTITAETKNEKWWNDISMRFDGGLTSEEEFATAKNIFGIYQNSTDTEVAQGYFFGVGFFYRPDKNFDFFIDGNYHKSSLLIGSKGGTLKGNWVWNESGGYSESPPLPDDVYYTANSTYLRIGARGILPINQNIELWAGLAFGAASWTVKFSNEDQTKLFSDVKTGFDFGLISFPLLGVDFNFTAKNEKTISISLFFDGARQKTSKSLTFDSLIWNGWEFTTSEASIVLPIRFGIAISGSF